MNLSSRLISQSSRIISRAFSEASRGDTGVLDGFHITPLGDSDMSQRSRVSMLSSEMLESKQIGVRGLSCYGFRMIDGQFLYGPVALFPKTVLSWRVPTHNDITPDSLSLFVALEPKIDILVLGVGDKKNIDKVRQRVHPFLKEHKIGLEIMDTEDAIATFNFLNAESRYVAAGLYPPDEMVITNEEYGRALNLLKGWDEVDENPLLMGINDSLDYEENLMKKLWSGAPYESFSTRYLEKPSNDKKALPSDNDDVRRIK
ncbi:unnamed protein product [Auanema sp. JU1783]|nr:unnamed protein product [Auanema sp. JU1783]